MLNVFAVYLYRALTNKNNHERFRKNPGDYIREFNTDVAWMDNNTPGYSIQLELAYSNHEVFVYDIYAIFQNEEHSKKFRDYNASGDILNNVLSTSNPIPTEAVSISLSHDLYRKINQEAIRQDVSISQVIEEAFDHWVRTIDKYDQSSDGT